LFVYFTGLADKVSTCITDLLQASAVRDSTSLIALTFGWIKLCRDLGFDWGYDPNICGDPTPLSSFDLLGKGPTIIFFRTGLSPRTKVRYSRPYASPSKSARAMPASHAAACTCEGMCELREPRIQRLSLTRNQHIQES
jgi:hypothetical protein